MYQYKMLPLSMDYVHAFLQKEKLQDSLFWLCLFSIYCTVSDSVCKKNMPTFS
jgi:hypothetical protein